MGHVVAYDLGWYGTFPHDGMATLFVLSTQGKSGILSGKGGQGRASSNVAPECPPGEQPRTRAVDGTLIKRSSTVRRSRKRLYGEQET